ncbi:MAG: M15 family metallopeptidase [Acidimicrobiia bacterium]
MRAAPAVLLAAALIGTGCDGAGDPDSGSPSSTGVTTSSSRPAAPPDTQPKPAPPPSYDVEATTVDSSQLPYSWRAGCPVGPESLRLLRLDHWGYDALEHRGQLVVHADQAAAMVEAFRILFEARFPIERMELVDVYGGDDAASTFANNTAGFNCRDAVGNPGVWSQHAYGAAVDINPLVNPYLRGTIVDPRYLDRAVDAPGLIRAGDGAVRAFESVGWYWGGYWASPDYQHFSATGS